jgi:cytoskeleton protein RodZ
MALFSKRKKPSDEGGREPRPVEDRGPTVVPLDAQPRTVRRRTVGQLLRETREGYGTDLERMAAALRIRAAYLEAIEEGAYDRLPGPVYALGFVRAYAVHLGLDGDEAVRRFKLEAEGFDGQRDLTFPVPLAERSIPGGTMVLTALIFALCGYGLWYYLSSSARPRPDRVSPVPVQLAVPLPPRDAAPAPASPALSSPAPAGDGAPNGAPPAAAAPVAPVAPPAAEAAPPVPPASGPSGPMPRDATMAAAAPLAPAEAVTAPAAAASVPPSAASRLTPPVAPVATAALPAAPPVPNPDAPHEYGLANTESRILIRSLGDAWIQVKDKGVPIFTNTLHPGETYRVPDRPGITMRTGRGSGLAFTVDGRQTPPIGGMVRSNVVLDPDRLLAGTAVPE